MKNFDREAAFEYFNRTKNWSRNAFEAQDDLMLLRWIKDDILKIERIIGRQLR